MGSSRDYEEALQGSELMEIVNSKGDTDTPTGNDIEKPKINKVKKENFRPQAEETSSMVSRRDHEEALQGSELMEIVNSKGDTDTPTGNDIEKPKINKVKKENFRPQAEETSSMVSSRDHEEALQGSELMEIVNSKGDTDTPTGNDIEKPKINKVKKENFRPQAEETSSMVSSRDHEALKRSELLEIAKSEGDTDKPTRNEKDKTKILDIKNEDIFDSIKNDDNKTTKNKINENSEKQELRRSQRTAKRKIFSYNEQNLDEDSEIEEDTKDTIKRKSRPIMINDKSLVEIAIRPDSQSTTAYRYEPQLELIGSKPKQAAKLPLLNYQSIVARGTTGTAMPKKTAQTITQAVQTSHTHIPDSLPSLDDNMFVVEAASFVIPYVYEKPSVKPLKEFVTQLGENIEQQRAEEEKQLLEKQQKIDRGEDEIELAARQEGKRHDGPEEDDLRSHAKNTMDSDVNKITDDNGTTITTNIKTEAVEAIQKSEELPTQPSDSNNYFEGPLGKFFMDIGMGLVEEYVQRDLFETQQQNWQRKKKPRHVSKEIETQLTNDLQISKQEDKSFSNVQIKCKHCSFKSESKIVLAHHMEVPHMDNDLYKCNFCEYETRAPHEILFHSSEVHNVRARLERGLASYPCVNCSYEVHGRAKLARHAKACAKRFKPEHNLCPPVDWEPPAKIPMITKGRQTIQRAQIPPPATSGRLQSVGASTYRPRALVPGMYLPRPVQAGGSIVRGSSILQQTTAAQVAMNAKKNLPSLSITPVGANPALPVLPPQISPRGTLMCEICDGYFEDLEQLRIHLQNIHGVKIRPKIIYNRPPLDCQKCKFSCFTDLGLERHLLCIHGLVSTSMQEAANKNRDAGKCSVCGKMFTSKLLNHMVKNHKKILIPALLSYKCTVCSASFRIYKLFEEHVIYAHIASR